LDARVFDLYAAAVTSGPFLLLVLANETRVFGPMPGGAHRRTGKIDLTLDLFVVIALAAAFFLSTVELVQERDDALVRQLVGYGLGIGALGAFVHVAATVWRLHIPTADDEGASNEPPG
jgi:hypothetical protein